MNLLFIIFTYIFYLFIDYFLFLMLVLQGEAYDNRAITLYDPTWLKIKSTIMLIVYISDKSIKAMEITSFQAVIST